MRRIYGDWTTPQMSGWKKALHEDAFQPQQQFRYTTGKNATDSALIIDAMDLLHSGVVSGFCIVWSDSDFTRLATRIREQGLFVMGIGRPETPKSFVNACEVFVSTTNIVQGDGSQAAPRKPGNGGDWIPTVREAIEAADGDGWTNGRMGAAVGDRNLYAQAGSRVRSSQLRAQEPVRSDQVGAQVVPYTNGGDEGRFVGDPRQGGRLKRPTGNDPAGDEGRRNRTVWASTTCRGSGLETTGVREEPSPSAIAATD